MGSILGRGQTGPRPAGAGPSSELSEPKLGHCRRRAAAGPGPAAGEKLVVDSVRLPASTVISGAPCADIGSLFSLSAGDCRYIPGAGRAAVAAQARAQPGQSRKPRRRL